MWGLRTRSRQLRPPAGHVGLQEASPSRDRGSECGGEAVALTRPAPGRTPWQASEGATLCWGVSRSQGACPQHSGSSLCSVASCCRTQASGSPSWGAPGSPLPPGGLSIRGSGWAGCCPMPHVPLACPPLHSCPQTHFIFLHDWPSLSTTQRWPRGQREGIGTRGCWGLDGRAGRRHPRQA